MNENVAFSVTVTAVCMVILAIFGLGLVFSGSPDYMDSVICSRLNANPRQCAALIAYYSAEDTITSTVTSTTTRKAGVE